jgi:hypothetical protein
VPKPSRSIEEREIIARQVFNEMRQGLSAYKACVKVGVPQGTFNGWLNEDEELAEDYARAREELHEFIAAEIMAIADAPVPSNEKGGVDPGAIQKQKLQVDTRKWLLSKLAPKKFGDKIELSGDANNPIKIERIERVVVGEVIEQRALLKKVEDDA